VNRRRTNGREAWLPVGFKTFFGLAAAYLVVFQLVPALLELREVQQLHAKHREKSQALESRLEDSRKRLKSLDEDPQAIERALDERQAVPPDLVLPTIPVLDTSTENANGTNRRAVRRERQR